MIGANYIIYVEFKMFNMPFSMWLVCDWVSLIAQLIRNLPAVQKTLIQFVGQEDLLEKGIGYPLQYSWASLVAQLVKNSPAMWETGFDPWVGKILWRRERLPTPVFWP